MDDAQLQVECPHCGALFGVADGPVGRRDTCPVCRGAVRVLAPQAELEPAAAPAVAQEQQDYFERRRRAVLPG